MKFLILLFFLFLIFTLITSLSVIKQIFRFLFGGGEERKNANRQTYDQPHGRENRNNYSGKNTKKIFSEEEGEYVEYEEIPEKKK